MGVVDLRHLLAGVLTLTMFVMLANMIKRDHIDPLQVELALLPTIHYDATGTSQQTLVTVNKVSHWPPKEYYSHALKPCWDRPPNLAEEAYQSQGLVTFSLTNGPEYHGLQVADALVIARYLRATLVVPDVRGTKPGDKRNFEEIYDVEKFIESLNGVVRVVEREPSDLSKRKAAVLRIPNMISEDHIAKKIEPIFRKKGIIRLTTYYPAVSMMRKNTDKKKTTSNRNVSVTCLGMFGTLEPQPQVHQVVDSMVERLRTLSLKSDGRQFIAVDLRADDDMQKKMACTGQGGLMLSGWSRRCYSPQEIGTFLRNIGFDENTPIYLTQSRWDNRLDALKNLFPNTYTKESIMPVEEKGKFLSSKGSEWEKVIDLYICSRSDIFVPAMSSGLFYANVAGKRIATGKTLILVPSEEEAATSPAPLSHFISPYITKKNHFAYSCLC